MADLRTRLRLHVLTFVLGVLLLAPGSVAQAQPGTGSDLLRVEDFDAACSKDTLDERSDTMCRQAISMALGKAPMVEEVPGADGRFTRTTKLMPADPAKAARLGEEACAHARWQSCMLYTMLLERGDGVPEDRARAEALTQYACSKGHSLACESLRSRGIATTPNVVPPAASTPRADAPRTGSANDRAIDMLQDWKQRQEAKQQQPLLPEQQLVLFQQQRQQEQQRAAAQAAANAPALGTAEADLITRCLAGTRDACFSLARGYEQGDGMPRDATKSAFYYEKACDIGHPVACEHVEKRAAAAASPDSDRISFGVPLALAFGGLALVGVLLARRRATVAGQTVNTGVRPAPVRPTVEPRR